LTTVKAPLGPNQYRWLKRIRSAGGAVELEHSRHGGFTAWVPVQGGASIRLPMRMFESLLERDLFSLTKDEGMWKSWKLLDDQEWERAG